jgi:hypothetical protein
VEECDLNAKIKFNDEMSLSVLGGAINRLRRCELYRDSLQLSDETSTEIGSRFSDARE